MFLVLTVLIVTLVTTAFAIAYTKNFGAQTPESAPASCNSGGMTEAGNPETAEGTTTPARYGSDGGKPAANDKDSLIAGKGIKGKWEE